jgi:hypothetical protein
MPLNTIPQIVPVDPPQKSYEDFEKLIIYLSLLVDEVNAAFTVIGNRLTSGGL